MSEHTEKEQKDFKNWLVSSFWHFIFSYIGLLNKLGTAIELFRHMWGDLNMKQSLANISEKLLPKLQKLLLILCVHYLSILFHLKRDAFNQNVPALTL